MLMARIALHREYLAATLLDGEVARLGRLEDLVELAREGIAIRKRLEKGAGGRVLCVGPLFHSRVFGVFQPAVIVGYLDAVVSVDDWFFGGCGRGRLRQQRGDCKSQNERNAEHAVKCTIPIISVQRYTLP